jgi:hypothetical protein
MEVPVIRKLEILCVVACSILSATTAVAQQAPAAPAAAEVADPEEQLDEGLKRFGYLAGVTRGCIAEAQRPELDRETLNLHASIARLLGTDRAYLFATSMGFGTSVTVDVKDCPNVLAAYDARVAKHRGALGGAK